MRRVVCLGLLWLPSAVEAAAPPAVPRDASGDPLPPGARLRLGTTRFRADSYRGLVLSADRRLMACGASYDVVRVCSTDTGKELGRVKADRWHQPAAFSPDGRLLEKGEPGCLEALRESAKSPPSLEGRLRAERLIAPYADKGWTPTGDELRGARAAAVLERIGDAEAVALLKKLAAGAPGFQTAEAKAALNRLGR